MPAPIAVSTTVAPTGMVCSVDHLASSAGIAALRAGGSAVDAAVAANAVLAVTWQHACGMGGDLFALVHHAAGPPAVLDAAGWAGSGADASALRAEGHARMPLRGDIRTVTAPGCVDGWLALHQRFGRLALGTVLEPARSYAADGFPASAGLIGRIPLIADVDGSDDYTARDLRPGDRVTRPGVARALGAVASGGREAFYEGEFGAGLLQLGRGHYEPADLATPMAQWVDPLGMRVWGHDVWTVPAPSQGYLTLASAWIADGLDIPLDGADDRAVHLLVEASRAAGFDRPDVLHEAADVAALVAPDRLAPRREAIDPDKRADWPVAAPLPGGTTYVCAVDADGMGVSLIQSNASGWGAHLAEPSTRIFLQNRGLGFSLEPGHPAELGPRRRPPHTLAPALVTRPDGSLRAVLGTMGGDSQPQIVLQLLRHLLAAGRSPGTAVSAPRFRLGEDAFSAWHEHDQAVEIEGHAPASWEAGLSGRGHRVVRAPMPPAGGFGHAHVIELTDDHMLRGAADPRAVTGSAAAY